MRNYIPCLLSVILSFPSAALAAEQPSAYAGLRADITKTLDDLEKKVNYLQANGSECSKYYNNNPCPGVAGAKTAHQGFILPLKDDFKDVRNFLKDKLTNVETELGKGIDQEKLKTVTACDNGADVAMESEKKKKDALDGGYEALRKLVDNNSKNDKDKGFKQKNAELHQQSAEFERNSLTCAKQVSSLAGMATMPKSPYEGLIKVFESSGAPGNCSPNVLQTYQNVAGQDGLLIKLTKQLDALANQMKNDSAKVAAVMAKTKPVASTCDTQPGKDAAANKPKEKESKVSGDAKPAVAQTDKAAVTGTAKSAEASIPKMDATAKTAALETKEAPAVSPPKGENTPADTAQRFLADTAPKDTQAKDLSVENTVPMPEQADVKPLTTADLNPKNTYQSNSDAEIKPTGETPKYGDDSSLGNTAPTNGRDVASVDSNEIRNNYQKSQFFQSRDLDLYSKKDTTYIQQALNQVNGGGVTVDGAYGKQTAAALDAVMKDPAKKLAFSNALRGLMK